MTQATPQTTTMSINRAMTSLKHLKKDINEYFTASGFLPMIGAARKHGNTPVTIALSAEEFSRKIQSNFDKYNSLVARYQAIKAAVVASNAKTIVRINGKDYTVAEALELKTIVSFKEALLKNLRAQFNQANKLVIESNEKLETQLMELAKNMARGNEGASLGDEAKTATEMAIKTVQESQRITNELALFDPINLREKIEELAQEISVVREELDGVLSDSNAKTEITITL